MDAPYCESKDTSDVVYNIAEIPLEVSYDMCVHEESCSLDCDNILSNHLDQSDVSPMCPHPSLTLEYILMRLRMILRFVILMLVWAVRTTCLMCLVEVLVIFVPRLL